MAGWKKQHDKKTVHVTLLQETHVASEEDAQALEYEWRRLGGLDRDATRPLSYWSTSGTKTGGVAILLHPDVAQDYARVEIGDNSGRVIAVESPTQRVVNVYAPNEHREREILFNEIQQWMETQAETGNVPKATILAGDFNCVLLPDRDRFTAAHWRSGRTESPALSELVQTQGLLDGLDIHTDGDEEPTLQRLTYWQDRSGSRIDRCYVSGTRARWVVSTESVTPWRQTDHRGVVTWLRDPACGAIRNPLATKLYPLHGRDADAMEREVRRELHSALGSATKSWDHTLRDISKALQLVRRNERQRATRQRKRRDARQRRHIETFHDLIQYVQDREERRERAKRAHRGRATLIQLQQTADDPGEDATAANIMARAWQPLLGRNHATVNTQHLPAACKALYEIPEERRLTATDNERLLQPITQDEVLAAIAGLGTRKAAGGDRLSNDFYRDWRGVLAPRLGDGIQSPSSRRRNAPSFTRAVIVPIPKGGTRTGPLNYRPISLLQSSYKMYTKVLADRVQRSLPKVINADQNGFVRGRALANNVNLVRAMLDQDYTHDEEAPESCPTIILLDFRKAYDTLNREYVLQALRRFGYADAFVQLVANLHCGTTARFLVNGDLSDQFDIVTGIRQGCPLAPLLFLLAAETLKHAIDKNKDIKGIQLFGRERDYVHAFSAFVDDSVVFLADRSMIHALMTALERFGALSGLQVQPPKSHAIALRPDSRLEYIGPFPVLQPGETAPYLGVEVGLANLQEVNWNKRVDKIEAKLGMLSQCTRSSQRHQHGLHIERALHGSVLYAADAHPPATGRYLAAYWEALGHKIAEQSKTDPAETPRTYPAERSTRTKSMLGRTDNMFALGLTLTRVALGRLQAPTTELRERKAEAIRGLRAPEHGLRWLTTTNGQFTARKRDAATWMQIRQDTYAAMPAEIRSFWTTFQWWDNTWIRDDNDQTLNRRDFPAIDIATIGELDITETDPGVFEFESPTRGNHGRSPAATRKLAKWLAILLINTAQLPKDPEGANPTRVYGLTKIPTFERYEWQHLGAGALVGRAIDQTWTDKHTDHVYGRFVEWGKPVRFLTAAGTARATADLQILPTGPPTVLQGHPSLQTHPTLPVAVKTHDTTGRLRKRMIDEHVRPLVTDVEQGLQRLIDRLERRELRHEEFMSALLQVPLTRLHQKPWGSTAQQHFLWYRRTLGAPPIRNAEGKIPECPYDFCAHTGPANMEHIMWDCTRARRAWIALLRRWTRRTTTDSSSIRATYIAGTGNLGLAPAIRAKLHSATPDDKRIQVTTRRAWRVSCEATAQSIWLQRNDAVHNGANPNVFEHAGKATKTVNDQLAALGAHLRTDETAQLDGRVLQTLAHALDEAYEAPPVDTRRIRLYFDGGSRGNPGVTGTDSVILENREGEQTWDIVWWDAHYLGEKATNNEAEHEALYGVILRQVSGDNETLQPNLQHAVAWTRQQLRHIHSYDFTHTLRSGNKMADLLANVAMDQKQSSTEPADNTLITQRLYEHAEQDTSHSRSSIAPKHHMIPALRAHLTAYQQHHPPASYKRKRRDDPVDTTHRRPVQPDPRK